MNKHLELLLNVLLLVTFSMSAALCLSYVIMQGVETSDLIALVCVVAIEIDVIFIAVIIKRIVRRLTSG